MKITTSISNPLTMFDKWFADYVRPADLKLPFDVKVAVAGRIDSPGPRDEMWEYILDVGASHIQDVLDHKDIGPGQKYFIFPDRYLQPGEAQSFISDLAKNPSAKKFGSVYIVTNQPYIVGGLVKEQIRLIRKAP